MPIVDWLKQMTRERSCRIGASFTPREHRAPAASAPSSRRSEKTSQRRSMWPRPMVCDGARAGEVQRPALREDLTAAGSLSRDCATICRAEELLKTPEYR